MIGSSVMKELKTNNKKKYPFICKWNMLWVYFKTFTQVLFHTISTYDSGRYDRLNIKVLPLTLKLTSLFSDMNKSLSCSSSSLYHPPQLIKNSVMFNNARLLDKEKVTGSLSRFGFVLISQLKHSQVNPCFPFAVRRDWYAQFR